MAFSCPLLALASGCAQAALPSPAPEVTDSPAPTPLVTPAPTPEPMTQERAAVPYARFLQDDIPGCDGYVDWLSWFSDLERAKELYRVRDLTGDGGPQEGAEVFTDWVRQEDR